MKRQICYNTSGYNFGERRGLFQTADLYMDMTIHKKAKSRRSLSTTRTIMLSFLTLILLGSILLALPISSSTGVAVPYEDALFTATTSTCVTGLVTVPTATSWSLFGQIVILFLIQIGGLGTVTIMAGFSLLVHKRMRLSDHLLIQDAFNLNTMSGLGSFIKKVIIGTLIVEGIGALCYMAVFVPQFGPRGIWISVFNAVSAFCNAGMDIVGENSLMNYATDPLVNGVTSVLIILGGLGYIVWWDVLRVFRLALHRHNLSALKQLTLHSKLAITATIVLLLGGGIVIFLLERENPLTIGEMSLWDQWQVSLFQSVTTRTAGFVTIDQAALTHGSVVTSLVLMFIGGSPVGTAGGVKTVTVLILMASAVNTFHNRDEITLFNRRIERDALRKSIAVVSMSFLIVFVSTLLLSCVCEASLSDLLYETVSATATVGLSRNLTSHLNTWGKMILICTMYLGRVGPISLAMAFQMRLKNSNMIKNPTEVVSVG